MLDSTAAVHLFQTFLLYTSSCRSSSRFVALLSLDESKRIKEEMKGEKQEDKRMKRKEKVQRQMHEMRKRSVQ